LHVEDEPDFADLVGAQLRGRGFIVDHVADAEGARSALETAQFGLVLLDRRLPDGEGLSVIEAVRRTQVKAPVIVVTALDAANRAVEGLDLGADDYIRKPFDIDELVARIRAVLRRAESNGWPELRCGRIAFDQASGSFTVAGQPLNLPRRELALLEALIRRARRVVQRDTLSNDIFGFNDDVQSNTLDAHVSRLRARLAAAEADVTIQPVRGVGYILDLKSTDVR
jgi:DNA-binding response OmpR family regulator